MEKNASKSLLMLLLSMVIFGSIGIFRRYIPLPSAALACWRGMSGALLLFLFVKARKKKLNHAIGGKKTALLALTGAMIGVNWILLFEAYNFTTVATATLCYYMQPTIVILLSPLAFGEKITLKKGLCVILSLVGMVFVSGLIDQGMPAFSERKGILLGLGAAVLYAAVVIMNKKQPGLDAYEKTIVQLSSAAAALVPYLLLSGQPVQMEWSFTGVILLLIVGFVHTGVAYALYFGSMDGLKAQTVAICSYLDPVTALLLAALILKEGITVYGILGAVLIIGSALISEIPAGKRIENERTLYVKR